MKNRKAFNISLTYLQKMKCCGFCDYKLDSLEFLVNDDQLI